MTSSTEVDELNYSLTLQLFLQFNCIFTTYKLFLIICRNDKNLLQLSMKPESIKKLLQCNISDGYSFQLKGNTFTSYMTLNDSTSTTSGSLIAVCYFFFRFLALCNHEEKWKVVNQRMLNFWIAVDLVALIFFLI